MESEWKVCPREFPAEEAVRVVFHYGQRKADRCVSIIAVAFVNLELQTRMCETHGSSRRGGMLRCASAF